MNATDRLRIIIERVQSIGETLKAKQPLKPADEAWLRIAGGGETLANINTISAALGCTSMSVRQAAWDGHFEKPQNGWMDVLDVLRGWSKRDRARLLTKTNADEKLKQTRNEILELRRDETKRLLIPAEEVRRTVMRAFIALRTRILIAPRRLSQTLAIETDPIEIETRIDNELRDALLEISRCEWYRASDDEQAAAKPSRKKAVA